VAPGLSCCLFSGLGKVSRDGAFAPGGMQTKSENQPHALRYAPGETMRSANAEPEAVPVAGDAER